MGAQNHTHSDSERERLEIERQKLELERERFSLERSKTKWTTISILVPLLIAALSIGYGIINQAQQAQREFEIKAAEIVMNADDPTAARNKARALAALFPGRLPSNFAESFDPNQFGSMKIDTENVRTLITLIAEYPDQKTQIIQMWDNVFPGDTWVDLMANKGNKDFPKDTPAGNVTHVPLGIAGGSAGRSW